MLALSLALALSHSLRTFSSLIVLTLCRDLFSSAKGLEWLSDTVPLPPVDNKRPRDRTQPQGQVSKVIGHTTSF